MYPEELGSTSPVFPKLRWLLHSYVKSKLLNSLSLSRSPPHPPRLALFKYATFISFLGISVAGQFRPYLSACQTVPFSETCIPVSLFLMIVAC